MDTTSPFSDRFTTYFIPSNVEREQIYHIMSSALGKRSLIDEKIRRFKALIDDLYHQRDTLDRYIQKHREMISGIRRLPLELIQTIFHYCLPIRNAVMSVDEAPLLLGCVCRTWQQIAYTTPQLWSSLHICLPPVVESSEELDVSSMPLEPHVDQRLKRYGEAIEAWLQRSSNLPLSLSVYSHENYGPADVATSITHTLFDILARSSSRWKTAAIHLGSRDLFASITRLRETDFPLLEQVKLTVDSDMFSETQNSLSLFQSPSLHSASMEYSRSFPVKWENITRLILHSPHPPDILTSDALNILRACPKLISCMISVAIYHTPSDMGTVTVPSLEVLRVIPITWPTTIPGGPPAFFGALNLPKLRHFEFDSRHEIYPTLPFRSFLSRISTIETLEYKIGHIPSAELVQVLTLTPSLKRLRLISDGTFMGLPHETTVLTYDNLLAFLTLLHSNSSICPRLEDIHVKISAYDELADETVLRFLLSRTIQAPPSIERLRRAHFEFERPCFVDIRLDIEPAIERGLQLVLSYLPTPIVPATYVYSPRVMVDLSEPGWWDNDFWENHD